MGTGITTQVQRLENGEWGDFDREFFQRYDELSESPFSEQNYRLFGFLADVRNDSICPVLKAPCGLPVLEEPGFGEGLGGAFSRMNYDPWPLHRDNHSKTWYLVSELLDYDYDIEFEDRDGSDGTLPKGSGKVITVREHIGTKFFKDLDLLEGLGDPTKTRVVISFDS